MTHQNEKEAIFNMQRYLRQLSYHDSMIPAPPLDGVFNTATKNSLMAFQRKEGLPATGVADKATWDLLFDCYNTSVKENAAPLAVELFPRSPVGYALRLGDKVFLVQLIQFLLKELEILYAGLDKIPQSGTYDEETAEAAREFQRRNRLPVTGEVDRQTWDALANTYNRTYRGYFEQ